MNPLTQGNRRSYEPVYSVNPSGGERRGAFIPLFLALTISTVSKFNVKSKKKWYEQTPELFKAQNLIAWGLLFIVLSLGTDYDSTYELAIALSWLILLSVAINNGQQFLKVTQAFVDTWSETQKGDK